MEITFQISDRVKLTHQSGSTKWRPCRWPGSRHKPKPQSAAPQTCVRGANTRQSPSSSSELARLPDARKHSRPAGLVGKSLTSVPCLRLASSKTLETNPKLAPKSLGESAPRCGRYHIRPLPHPIRGLFSLNKGTSNSLLTCLFRQLAVLATSWHWRPLLKIQEGPRPPRSLAERAHGSFCLPPSWNVSLLLPGGFRLLGIYLNSFQVETWGGRVSRCFQ